MLVHAPTAPTPRSPVLTPKLELCVETLPNAEIAARGGAHRIELCTGLADGGLTPSLGLLEQVLAGISIPVHCMIRPRGGDFCYTPGELRIMEQDIALAKAAGAAGVVLGVLTRDGKVDIPATRRLVEAARPLQVTFHRAFDVAHDLDEALDDVITAGADIVLTSGGAERITEAVPVVARLVKRAGTRIEIMGGSGVRIQNARALSEATGVAALHTSLRHRLCADGRKPAHVLPDAPPAYELREEDVRALATILRNPDLA
jgi:copper homeostasis protein